MGVFQQIPLDETPVIVGNQATALNGTLTGDVVVPAPLAAPATGQVLDRSAQQRHLLFLVRQSVALGHVEFGAASRE